MGLAFVPWLYWQIERTVDNRIREQIHTTVEMPGMIGMDYSEQPRSIVSLFRMAISGDLGYRKWIPRKFVERFFEAHYMLGETGIQISYVVFIICMVITLYFVFMGENDNIEKGMKQFKKTIIYISIVLACWFGFYLCAYMFMMNRFEGSLLASFERYISTGLMVPGYVFVFGLYFFVSRQKESLKKVTVPLYIALLCIFLPLSEAVYFIDGHNKEEAIKEWETVQELCDKADKLQFGIEDKILFVSQEDTGEKQWWINYHIYPTKIQRGPWRFHDEAQAVSAERAYSSSTITASELRDYLAEKGVTYVMIHKTDEYFIKAFGELFASGVKIEENTIYLFDSSNRLLVRAL